MSLQLSSALGSGVSKLRVNCFVPFPLCRDMVLFQPNSPISSSKVLAMYRKEPFTIHASYANPESTPTGKPEIGLLSIDTAAVHSCLQLCCVARREIGLWCGEARCGEGRGGEGRGGVRVVW